MRKNPPTSEYALLGTAVSWAPSVKSEFREAISLLLRLSKSIRSVGAADASGANASAAPVASPAAAAILRTFMVDAFQRCRRRFGCTAGGPPQHRLPTPDPIVGNLRRI